MRIHNTGIRNDFSHVLQEKVGALQEINFDVQQKCVTAVLQSTDGRGRIISCIFQIVSYLIFFFLLCRSGSYSSFYTCWKIRINFFDCYSQQCQFVLFIFLVSAVGVIIFNILGSIL
jgi:hypothetical protein